MGAGGATADTPLLRLGPFLAAAASLTFERRTTAVIAPLPQPAPLDLAIACRLVPPRAFLALASLGLLGVPLVLLGAFFGDALFLVDGEFFTLSTFLDTALELFGPPLTLPALPALEGPAIAVKAFLLTPLRLATAASFAPLAALPTRTFLGFLGVSLVLLRAEFDDTLLLLSGPLHALRAAATQARLFASFESFFAPTGFLFFGPPLALLETLFRHTLLLLHGVAEFLLAAPERFFASVEALSNFPVLLAFFQDASFLRLGKFLALPAALQRLLAPIEAFALLARLALAEASLVTVGTFPAAALLLLLAELLVLFGTLLGHTLLLLPGPAQPFLAAADALGFRGRPFLAPPAALEAFFPAIEALALRAFFALAQARLFAPAGTLLAPTCLFLRGVPLVLLGAPLGLSASNNKGFGEGSSRSRSKNSCYSSYSSGMSSNSSSGSSDDWGVGGWRLASHHNPTDG